MDNINLGILDNIESVLKAFKQLRSKYKNQWVCCNFTYNGKSVECKLYDTWLQIARVNGVNISNCMDQTVTQFNAHVTKMLKD